MQKKTATEKLGTFHTSGDTHNCGNWYEKVTIIVIHTVKAIRCSWH